MGRRSGSASITPSPDGVSSVLNPKPLNAPRDPKQVGSNLRRFGILGVPKIPNAGILSWEASETFRKTKGRYGWKGGMEVEGWGGSVRCWCLTLSCFPGLFARLPVLLLLRKSPVWLGQLVPSRGCSPTRTQRVHVPNN